jgi:intraflagellar transport protein 57
LYLSWEGSLERLKLMNYERDYCRKLNKKPFSRVHFVIPGNNASHQFDDFVSLCSWLSSIILGKNDAFKREEFDDPNTVVNKLMLVLRQMDFRSTFAAQKLKVAYGEATCHVLDFLTEKLMLSRGLQWESPLYQNDSEVIHP